MRAFIGIPLPEKTREEISEIYPPRKGIKAVEKENLHITVKFLGEIGEDTAEEIKKEMDSAVLGVNRSAITINKISAFPTAFAGRIIWLNVDKGAGTVTRIFENIESRLEKYDLKEDGRVFVPHITVGRSKNPVDLSAAAGKKFEISSEINSVALYKSELTQYGAKHTVLYEKTLRG